MYNFWTIVKYEYKKLFMRKLVWISLALMMVFCVLASCLEIQGSYYIDGELQGSHYEMLQNDIRYARALSGRAVDDELIKETLESETRIPEEEIPARMEEYYANITPYKGIRELLGDIINDYGDKGVDETELYASRREMIESMWKSDMLTPGEITYLSGLEEQVEVPFIYQYAQGYKQLLALLFIIGIMTTLLISICVPIIFSEEHNRKTDQLILCSRLGKGPLYLAKVVVGVTFSVAANLLLCLSAGVTTFIIYGTDGFGAQMQLLRPMDSWLITAGQAVCILIMLNIVAAVLHCAAAMLLSEWIGSGVTTMAVMVGFLLFSQVFHIPYSLRILSQMWDFIPGNLVSTWGAFSDRLVPVFGTYLTQWQAAPALYILLSGVVLWICYGRYRKYQIGAR